MRARVSTRAQASVREETDSETLTETLAMLAREVLRDTVGEVIQKQRAGPELEPRAVNILSSRTSPGRWVDVASRAPSMAETLRQKAEGWTDTDLLGMGSTATSQPGALVEATQEAQAGLALTAEASNHWMILTTA